jgi:hypothetical protein
MLISGVLYFLYLYNKPFKNIEKSKADIELTAQFLIEDYEINESDANAKYLDKLIQIEGEISDISINNGNSVITLKHSTSMSSVICNMLPEYNVNTLKLNKGDTVLLKGICTGYLLDIILINCVLVKNK